VSRSVHRRRGTPFWRGNVAWLYLAPALLFYLVFVIIPWLNSVWYSLYDWDGIGAATWVGLQNYVTVFTDPEQAASLAHAFGLIVFFSVLPICCGLVIAALVAGDAKGRWGWARALIFLPQVLPLVAVGVAWKSIYSDAGLVNSLLRAVGLDSAARPWLGDFDWAFPAVGFVGAWVGTGLCVVLFSSAIQRIDQSLYEAARLDGAGPVREFFSITIPQLRGEIGVAATVTVIAALASFDIIYVMTLGGPGTSTMVPGVEIYRLAFSYNKVGLASALSVALSLIVYGVVIIINLLARPKDTR